MLTVVKVAFSFCIIFLAFEETVSWTIDLPQVRKYFFEKRLEERERQDRLRQQPVQRPEQVVYDNIHTKSLHFDYEKYKEHYADDYKYNGYMEQKVHEAVQNGSAYLDGLRRAIEAYLQRLESCRQQNMTVNIIQLRPNFFSNQTSNFTLADFLTNPANPITNPTNPNLIQSAILNLLLPRSTTGVPDLTSITQMTTNFTNFMAMSANYTMFNMSDEFRDCMRADLASEHVRRLAELAVWAASELQDKLYAEKYSEHDLENEHNHENTIGNAYGAESHHDERGYYPETRSGHERGPYGHGLEIRYGHGHEIPYHGPRYGHEGDKGHHEQEYADDTLVLRLAWFLDRLAHLTGFDPKAQDFVEQSTARPSNDTPSMMTWMPTMIPTADLQFLMTCIGGTNGTATERCAYRPPDGPPNPNSLQARGWPAPRTPDLNPSGSDAEEYTYSEQEFTDDDMPLSLPQRPAKTKRKRSVQGDPLQNFVRYYAKFKTWTGSNQEEKDSSELSHVTNKENADSNPNLIRKKRFIVKKKTKYFKPENPFPKLGSYVKHKVEVHIKKDEKGAKGLKKFLEKLHQPKTEVKLLKFKKTKRSIKYSKKEQPRVPNDPQMDISYYVKNKPGRSYNYNVAQAVLVRAGLEQAFQTGNLLVVQRYGSNYNPANRDQIVFGYVEGLTDS